jgi:hypothetical protein
MNVEKRSSNIATTCVLNNPMLSVTARPGASSTSTDRPEQYVSVAIGEQMAMGDLQALHRVRERLVGQRTCARLMTVPGIGPIISSAMVAAIGNGAAFSKGRDFGAWLGLVPRQISPRWTNLD